MYQNKNNGDNMTEQYFQLLKTSAECNKSIFSVKTEDKREIKQSVSCLPVTKVPSAC